VRNVKLTGKTELSVCMPRKHRSKNKHRPTHSLSQNYMKDPLTRRYDADPRAGRDVKEKRKIYYPSRESRSGSSSP
jgi:hypothetical protein